MFDEIEEAFDDVSSSIQHAAVPTFGLSIRARWDNGLRARRADGVHEGVRVVTFVSNHGTRAQMLDQFVRTRNVRDLSFSDNHSQRPLGFIDGQMQLGRQSSARAAERLRAAFFRAPAECWCARTMVESISTRLISVSSDTACATFPHAFATPPREAHVHRMPSAELFRQIAPRATRAADPEDCFDKPAIVGRRAPWIAFLAGQDRFDSCPYFIAQ